MVSPLYCPIHERAPGPCSVDESALSTGVLQFHAIGDPAEQAAGTLTLNIIRQELTDIVGQRAAEDPNPHYLDGRELNGESDFAELSLPDRLHPDATTHRRIAERFAARTSTAPGPFAGLTSVL